MDKSERELALKWIKTWKAASLELEKERTRDIKEADSREFVRCTSGMVDAVMKTLPPRRGSGLVEQQKYFMRAAR